MRAWEGYMRGVNLGGWISQCPRERSHYDEFIKEKDIRMIASWGLDHVRLPIDNDIISDEQGHFLPEGIKHVDNCIQWCKDSGLNIILDLHKAPGYAFYGTANTLFEDPGVQDTFVYLWKEFAARYGKYSDFVSFELLNEVVDADTSLWNDLIRRTISAIREFAPVTKIVVGGIRWNSASSLQLLDAPYDENIVFTYHFYDPFLFTHQGAQWIKEMSGLTVRYPGDIKDYRRISRELNSYDSGFNSIGEMGIGYLEERMLPAINTAKKYNVLLYCGEYGVDSHAPKESTVNWYMDIRKVFDKYDIARAAWTYKSLSFGISNLYGDIMEQIVENL